MGRGLYWNSGSNRKALAATALTDHIGIMETEGSIHALYH